MMICSRCERPIKEETHYSPELDASIYFTMCACEMRVHSDAPWKSENFQPVQRNIVKPIEG